MIFKGLSVAKNCQSQTWECAFNFSSEEEFEQLLPLNRVDYCDICRTARIFFMTFYSCWQNSFRTTILRPRSKYISLHPSNLILIFSLPLVIYYEKISFSQNHYCSFLSTSWKMKFKHAHGIPLNSLAL